MGKDQRLKDQGGARLKGTKDQGGARLKGDLPILLLYWLVCALIFVI